MRDLRSALAIARKNVAKPSGNTGYSGNSSRKVSQNNNLDHSEPVSTAATRVATVATDSVDVATVATAFHAVDTPDGISKRESKQSLREAVATVSTVATENQQVGESLDEGLALPRWRAGMASFQSSYPPCPGYGADRWLLVRRAASQFLDEFGEQAAALGWRDLDLFGVHPEVGILRGNCSGAIVLSSGRRIVAVSKKTIAYEDKLTFYRKPARERGPSVVVWEFKKGSNG